MYNYDLQIIQGVDFGDNISIIDDNGNLLDLSLCSGYAHLRTSFGATGLYDLNLQFTIPQSGQLSISMNNQETSILPTTIGIYDVMIINPSGAISKILWGHAYIYPSTL